MSESLPKAWRVLVVDDDLGTLQVTRLALQGMSFQGRPLELLQAASAADARRLLLEGASVALILLDVVMESEFAGLELVRFIREGLGDKIVRIAIRTGQPGVAPEMQVLQQYDVNDYREKTDLTAARLRAAVVVNLRAYLGLYTQIRIQAQLVALNQCTQAMQVAATLPQLFELAREYLNQYHDIDELVLLSEQGHWSREPADRWQPVFNMRDAAAGLGDDMAAVFGAALKRDQAELSNVWLDDEFFMQSFYLGAAERAIVVMRVPCAVTSSSVRQMASLFAHAFSQAYRGLQLSLELRRLAQLPLELPIPLMRVSGQGCLLFANEAAAPVLQAWNVVVGDPLPPSWVARICDPALLRVATQVEERVDNGVFELTLSAVPDSDHFNIYGRDITETRHVLARLHHAAFHDELTGLYNRSYFGRVLDSMITEADRRQGRLGLVMIDLDEFKQVNDIHGHAIGDEVLRQVARRLQDRIRHGDVLARLGGDEFAVLTQAVSDDASLAAMADRLRACISSSAEAAHMPPGVTLKASVGHTAYPADADNASDLLRCADLAMYHAKKERLQGVSAYDGEVHRRVRRRAGIEALLTRALEEDRLEVHYQPIVSIADGLVRSVEALARVRADNGEWLNPAEFIAVAEASQLIGALSRRVLSRALRDVTGFRRFCPQLRLAFNASGCLLRDLDFVSSVAHQLAEAGFEPGGLDLELTESMLIGDTQAVIGRLHEFKAMGIQLSVDDFGTGYSSLSYLSVLPVAKVKIDRSFVHGVTHRDNARAIVGAIISLGSSLGLEVVAEGVEGMAQLQLLGSMGCHLAQGFHFSKALSATDCEQWLALHLSQREAQRDSHGTPH